MCLFSAALFAQVLLNLGQGVQEQSALSLLSRTIEVLTITRVAIIYSHILTNPI